MKTNKIKNGDWVVVCDGRKALILLNKGDEKFPDFHVDQVFEHPDRSTHELGSGAPGRVHQSDGAARSSVRQTDWHDAAEQQFLHTLAHHIDHAMKMPNAPDSIFIVASPRALGMLRNSYTSAMRGKIRAEIGKDYVTLPIHEIEKHLAADLKDVAFS